MADPFEIPKPQPIDKPPLPDSAMVEKRMTGLLSKSSPFMQGAETYGLQQANKHGLLSSSMAVGAAENARIQAALPIAQQDAKAEVDSALVHQNYLQDQDKLGYQGKISSTIQAQQDAGAFEREKFSQEATTARTGLENEAKLQIASMQLQQEDSKALQSTLASLGQQYEREYSALLTATNFASAADRNKAIGDLAAIYKINANLAASVAGVTLQWT